MELHKLKKNYILIMIKKHALLNKPYGMYVFSYERIKDSLL